jgi:hypothetical protein
MVSPLAVRATNQNPLTAVVPVSAAIVMSTAYMVPLAGSTDALGGTGCRLSTV